MMKKSWQELLSSLQRDYESWQEWPKGPDFVEIYNELMQRSFPGPYRVIERYDFYQGKADLDLEFDDPREKTLWLLRWS